MKGKYITRNILLVCASYHAVNNNNIHAELAETIAQRKIIVAAWENSLQERLTSPAKDIHAELKETISNLTKAARPSGSSAHPRDAQQYSYNRL